MPSNSVERRHGIKKVTKWSSCFDAPLHLPVETKSSTKKSQEIASVDNVVV